jgi:hypothetical protein
MSRYLYLIHDVREGKLVTSPFITTKARALKDGKFVKALKALVSRAASATFDGGRQYGIDAPTFLAQSDVIADFRTAR